MKRQMIVGVLVAAGLTGASGCIEEVEENFPVLAETPDPGFNQSFNGAAQNEPQLVRTVLPDGRAGLVVAYNDFTKEAGGGLVMENRKGLAFSDDGGASWDVKRPDTTFPLEGTVEKHTGDPRLDTTAGGEAVVYASLADDVAPPPDASNALVFSRSDDGGQSWFPALPEDGLRIRNTTGVSSVFLNDRVDKPSFVLDDRDDESVVAAYRFDRGRGLRVTLVRVSDDGRSSTVKDEDLIAQDDVAEDTGFHNPIISADPRFPGQLFWVAYQRTLDGFVAEEWTLEVFQVFITTNDLISTSGPFPVVTREVPIRPTRALRTANVDGGRRRVENRIFMDFVQDDEGRAYIVWEDQGQIRFKTTDSPGAWDTFDLGEVIGGGTQNVRSLQPAVTASGERVAVTFYSQTSIDHDTFFNARVSDDGGTTFVNGTLTQEEGVPLSFQICPIERGDDVGFFGDYVDVIPMPGGGFAAAWTDCRPVLPGEET